MWQIELTVSRKIALRFTPSAVSTIYYLLPPACRRDVKSTTTKTGDRQAPRFVSLVVFVYVSRETKTKHARKFYVSFVWSVLISSLYVEILEAPLFIIRA